MARDQDPDDLGSDYSVEAPDVMPEPRAHELAHKLRTNAAKYRELCIEMRERHDRLARFWEEEANIITQFMMEDQLLVLEDQAKSSEQPIQSIRVGRVTHDYHG